MSTTPHIPSEQLGVFRDGNGDESSTATTPSLRTFPVPQPGPGEVLIQNVAVASNPKDWKHPQWEGNYSYVEGSDVAGYVVKFGSSSSSDSDSTHNWKEGESVAAFTKMGTQDSKYGAYAQYSVAPISTTIPIPDYLSFEEAATLPLAVFTAAVGLFVNLGLMQPPSSGGAYKGSDRAESAVIVYGASSSVGAYVVQLAKRAGYFVVGVAGSSADYAKSLGADVVVDYRGKSLEQLELSLVESLAGHSCISAYDTITDLKSQSTLALARTLARVSPGGKSKVTHLLPLDEETKNQIPPGVAAIETYVGSAIGEDETFCARFARELTSYLTPSPTNPTPLKPNRVKLMPNGLASVGEGLDLLQSGKVHGEKLVYRIQDTPGLRTAVAQ